MVLAPRAALRSAPVKVTEELLVVNVVPVPKTGAEVVSIESNVAKSPRVDRSPNSHHFAPSKINSLCS